VLKFDERKAELAELAQQSKRIVEIRDGESYDECHGARMTLKNTRVVIEKLGKAAREDATAFSKAVIAKENELISVISSEEIRLQKLQQAWDDDREAERAEKERIEQESIVAERRMLEETQLLPLRAIGKSAAEIKHLIEIETERDFDEVPESIRDKLLMLSLEAIAKLHVLLNERITSDAESKRLADEREALERTTSADRAREAAERAERDRQAQLERDNAAEASRLERVRLDAEAKANREEADRLLAERAKLARDQEAAEAKRLAAERADRLQKLKDDAPPLLQAAIDAHSLLCARGLAEDEITLTLGFAIEREG
jgi:hypothetical protein